jgi:EAL domain-containing protein (putative c-di-GMP-specific phosphodiesterase class I)
MSAGIAVYRHGEETMAALLSEADGCLYEAKRAGRDRVVASDANRRGILWRAGMLHHALRERRIVPAYQAIVDLRTRKVVASEALARLVTPDGRVMSASEFIEAAEGINLIHEVDWLIARDSLGRCAVRAATDGAPPSMYFINLSAQFLARKELVRKLLQEAEGCCRKADVVFEITERQFIGNMDDVLRHLQPLLDYGMRLALDDFGSGYSSFLYLAQLPISFLKIEGWMVANLARNPRIGNMIQSIVWLARHQGITTIAECVENEETARRLSAMGVDWAQGHHFGAPQREEPASLAM